ncbi:MAG TPA: hypothetical protein DDW52_08775 [Planctomycetaceae bacterium]|nr:hypothetical protein [Planctomycetaceae bacterium]
MKQLSLLSLAVALCVGCGGESNPPTSPVTGVVKLDGKAIEGAQIAFIADPSNPDNRAAAGVTDAEGRYSLTSFVSGDGAMAGKYNITVTKYDTPDGGANPYGDGAGQTIDENLSEEEQEAARDAAYAAGADDMAKSMKAGARQTPKNALPEKYAAITTSGLTFTVKDGEDNEFNIELQKK